MKAGRGKHYSPLRNLVEETLLRVYRSGWAADLTHRLGLPRRVRVRRHDLVVRGWPGHAPPLRLAFGSDFHAGPTTHPALLEDACAALAAARPHVLLLGGDFIFLRAEFIDRRPHPRPLSQRERGARIDSLAEMLGRIPAPLGRYAVLGNHDLWADDAHIVRRLTACGVTVLVNRSVALPPPYDAVSICGLDDAWTGRPDAEAALFGSGPVRVVLMHAPSGLLALSGRPFSVALCGHTHGGHIALPGGVPIVAPGPLSRRYPHGHHQVTHAVGRGHLLVSRGIGGVEVPLRLFAPPDVLWVTLGGPTAPQRRPGPLSHGVGEGGG